MTRCLDERELFAAMDGRIAGKRKEHVSACTGCASRVDRMQALRAAIRDASAPPSPDWDRMETRMLRSIRTAAAPGPAIRWTLAPVGLSFAAALLVIVAIVIGRQPTTGGMDPVRAMLTGVPIARVDARTPLDATVSERFGAGAPGRDGRVLENDEVDYGPGGGARIALGDDIEVDEVGPARLAVASLDEWRPTIRLDSGAFRIAVFEGALPQELVVLAAHAEFTVYSGSAEVLLVDDVLELRAVDGPLRVDIGGAIRELASGDGLRGDASSAVDVTSSWTRLPASWGGAASTDVPLLNLDRPGGTLPKHVVRAVLHSNTDRMRACYETALKRYQGLESLPVTARLRVGVNGRVARLNVVGVESWPELKRCLVGVLESMRFPPPSGGEVDLIAPLRLTPLD
jgi:hypothetical protein